MTDLSSAANDNNDTEEQEDSPKYRPTNPAYCDLLTAALISGGSDDSTLHRKDLVALIVMLLDTLRTVKTLSDNHLGDSCTCNAVGDLDEVPIDPTSPSFLPATNPFGGPGGFSSWLNLAGVQKEECSVSTEYPMPDAHVNSNNKNNSIREADSFLTTTIHPAAAVPTPIDTGVITTTVASVSPRSLHHNPTTSSSGRGFRLTVSPRNADSSTAGPLHLGGSARGGGFPTPRTWSVSSVDATPNDNGGLPTFQVLASHSTVPPAGNGLRVRMSMSLPFTNGEEHQQQQHNSSERKSACGHVAATETPKNARRLRVRSVAFTVSDEAAATIGGDEESNTIQPVAHDDPNLADALASSTMSAAQQQQRTERSKSLAPRKSLMISTTLTTFEDNDDDTGIVLVNQYLMMGEIGAGASGVVYEVTDTTTNKDYAMKMIKRDRFAQRRVSMGGSVTVTTNREVAIMKKLRHPHIVRLHEVIDDPSHNKLYLVMQLLTGGRLCPSLDAATGACEPVAA
ncbi:calcium calmodulin-dependent protein kinase kinase beta isoform 2, putative, partial [Bodo saltans]